jgi:hypothetical protein
MVDLDQSSGAITRQWERVYMGPSIGWLDIPGQNVQPIVAAGTYNIDASINLIEVSVAAPVTIVLPSCVFPAAGAQAQPGLFANNPITVVDVGGNAQSNNITISANNVSETVMSLASIKIATNYGGFTLQPVSALKTWTSISP